MKYKVVISESAVKHIRKLEQQTINRIKKQLQVLEEDPFHKRSGADVKKLKGFRNPELYRLRVGDYRIVYTVIENAVKVTEVFHRGKEYSWLN